MNEMRTAKAHNDQLTGFSEIIDHSPKARLSLPAKPELALLLKRLRNALPTGVEDGEFNLWLKNTVHHCFYDSRGGCSTTLVLDHCLGGYQGTKACGLLKIVSCTAHNQQAETDPVMHVEALSEAILMRLLYDCEKLKEEPKRKRR